MFNVVVERDGVVISIITGFPDEETAKDYTEQYELDCGLGKNVRVVECK